MLTTTMLMLGGSAALLGAMFEAVASAGVVDAALVAGATAVVVLSRRDKR